MLNNFGKFLLIKKVIFSEIIITNDEKIIIKTTLYVY